MSFKLDLRQLLNQQRFKLQHLKNEKSQVHFSVSRKKSLKKKQVSAIVQRQLNEEAWERKLGGGRKTWYQMSCLGSKDTCPIVQTNIFRAKLDSV